MSKFYAILPANVRHNKQLSAAAKLLYAEITAGVDERGICEMTNAEFASLLGGHEKTVCTWIRQLREQEHISVAYWSDRAGYRHRRIYVPTKATKLEDEYVEEGPGSENTTRPGSENATRGAKTLPIYSTGTGRKGRSSPLKTAEAAVEKEPLKKKVRAKVGVMPEESVTASAEAQVSDYMAKGYKPIRDRMNEWDKMEEKLRLNQELAAPHLLLVFRKVFREAGLGEYPSAGKDLKSMKAFIEQTPDLTTAGRIRIINYYLKRYKYRHKEWGVESTPTVGIMVGFLRQYMNLALKEEVV
jgi:hypothetical protein